MKKSLLIVGNGGHGKVVLDCAKANGFKKIAFLTNYDSQNIMGIKCLNENKVNFFEVMKDFPNIIVALGNNSLRLEKSLNYQKMGFKLATLIHPKAFVSESTKIGEGSVILPFAAVNSSAIIGKACIINTAAVVEHDCVLGDGVHISPNAAMGGNVIIGKNSWLCLGASVKNAVKIGENCIIGAGAAVIGDIENNFTVVGVPAKLK